MVNHVVFAKYENMSVHSSLCCPGFWLFRPFLCLLYSPHPNSSIPVLLNFSELCLIMLLRNLVQRCIQRRQVFLTNTQTISQLLGVYGQKEGYLEITKDKEGISKQMDGLLSCYGTKICLEQLKMGHSSKTFLSKILFWCHFGGISESTQLRQKQKGFHYPRGKIYFIL